MYILQWYRKMYDMWRKWKRVNKKLGLLSPRPKK